MSTPLRTMRKEQMAIHLVELLDSGSFTEFRNYYLRSGIYNTIGRYKSRIVGGKFESYNDPEPSVERLKAKEYTNLYMEAFGVFENDRPRPAFEAELERKILDAQNRSDLTPYDRVGLVYKYIKEQLNTHKINQHTWLRMAMEKMLIDWTIRDLSKQPNTPVVTDIADAYKNIINQKNQMPNERWAHLWNLDGRGYSPQMEDGSDRPQCIKRQELRDTIRKNAEPGSLILLSSVFKRGYQLSSFSWAAFDNYLEHNYVLTATEETFDKKYFSEWLAGFEWSCDEHKERYEQYRDEQLKKWLSLVEAIVSEEITYLFPRPIDVYEFRNSLHKKQTINFQDTSVFKERVVNYPGFRKQIATHVLEKHPSLYFYKEMCSFMTDSEMRSVLERTHPSLLSAFDIINELTIGTENNKDYYGCEDKWHQHDAVIKYMLQQKESGYELPDLNTIFDASWTN